VASKADLLASLRIRLDDVPAAGDDPRWSDEELELYLADAVKRYSQDFPRLREQQGEVTTAGTRYDAPADLLDDAVYRITLTSPSGVESEVYHYLSRGRTRRWWRLIGDVIAFGFQLSVGSVLLVEYDALHELPETGDCTVPVEDEEMVLLWAMHLAFRRTGGNDATLSRWTDDRKRDDSPLIPHHRFLADEYQRRVRDKRNRTGFARLERPNSRRDRYYS
jgi:hypothetical protein